MKIPRPRLSVRMMIGLVAVAAGLLWAWRTYFDPVRRWKDAIRDKYDVARRSEGFDAATTGRVPGISTDMAIAEFIELLGDKDPDPTVRLTAVIGCCVLKGKAKAAIPALIGTLRDKSPEVKIATAITTWRIFVDLPEDYQPGRDVVSGLIAAMKDPDRQVRRWSACCLGWIGEGEVAIPTLIEALAGPDLDGTGRMQVIEALRRTWPKAGDALPAVLETVEAASIDEGDQGGEVGRRGNARVQIQAAKFLHTFGETGLAVAILRRLANDQDPQIGAEAKKLLGSIEPGRSPNRSEASQ